MSSVPNSYIDDLRSIVLATLNRIEQLRMRVVYGVQFVKGTYGQELEFRSDGNTYLDDVLLTGAGATDHGSLLGLGDDDHTHYLLVNGGRDVTGDLTINSASPELALEESGSYRGGLYMETDDSIIVKAEVDNLSLVTAATTGGDIVFWPEGVASFKLTATGAISYQDINIDTTSTPVLGFYEGTVYRGAIGIGSSDEIIVQSEHGGILLGTFAGTGGTIDINPKAGGVVASFDSAAIDFTQPLDMNGDAITNAAIAGTNSGTFKINQDNVGVEASAIEFDRGSVATAARILWSEANDWFSFEEVTGSTKATIDAAKLQVSGDINLDGSTGTIKISEDDGTGDMVLQVASGDSIVFKAV